MNAPVSSRSRARVRPSIHALARRVRAVATEAVALSSGVRRVRAWRHTALGGAPAPPSAWVGLERVPGLGFFVRLRTIVSDPVGLVARARESYGDVFTIRIPLNSFDLVYLMDREGYQYVLSLSADEGRMGKVMLNVPTVGFWFPRSDPSEAYMQSLIVGGRALMAGLLRHREVPHEETARAAVARHLPRWTTETDIAEVIVELVHDASAECLLGRALWQRLRPVAGPALRVIADGVDVVRVSLAKTPYGRFMPEYRASRDLYDVLCLAIEEHDRTGAFSMIDRVRAAEVDGAALREEDLPWMLMSVLWNSVTYTGAYAVWAWCDLLAHPEALTEVLAVEGTERAKRLGWCFTETLRLNPVASLPRWIREPIDIVHNGRRYHIGASTYLSASPVTHCTDAETYASPERWDPLRYARGEPAPSLFGRGAFGCVAQGFVYRLVTTVFDALLTAARFELTSALPSRVSRVHLTYPSVAITARVHSLEAPRPSRGELTELGRSLREVVTETFGRNFVGVPPSARLLSRCIERFHYAQTWLDVDLATVVAALRSSARRAPGVPGVPGVWRERRVSTGVSLVRYVASVATGVTAREFLFEQSIGIDNDAVIVVSRGVSSDDLAPPRSYREGSPRGRLTRSVCELRRVDKGVRVRRALCVDFALGAVPQALHDAMVSRALDVELRAIERDSVRRAGGVKCDEVYENALGFLGYF